MDSEQEVLIDIMAMTKQERAAYNKAYYQRRKANGGKRLTKVSTTKSAAYQRKRRAKLKKNYINNQNSYNDARAKIEERIKKLEKISKHSGNQLLKAAAKQEEMVRIMADKERTKAIGNRTQTSRAYKLFVNAAKGLLNSKIADERLAKNQAIGMVVYLANKKHPKNRLTLKKSQKSGDLSIDYSKAVNKTQAYRDVDASTKYVKRNSTGISHVYSILDSLTPDYVYLDSETLEEVIEDYVSSHDDDWLFDPTNSRQINDEVMENYDKAIANK